MEKIKEIAEFAKMFKLNVPVEEHFEYYINTLSRSVEFKNIYTLVDDYSKFEKWLKDNGFQNVGHYKMNYAYHLIKNHLENSMAYQECQKFDYSTFKFYEKDHLKMHEGNFMLSLDFSSANFQSMKIFDKTDELKKSWVELCDSLKIHPMLASSKSFRQVVFGNLNPKRFQKIQHLHMIKLVEEISEIINPEDIIFISHDEMVINLGDVAEDIPNKVLQINNIVKVLKERRFSKVETWMEVKPTVFTLEKISKGIYIKRVYSTSVDLNGVLVFLLYKSLFGCPGNLYYMNFKKHILEEEIEERDCLFVLENKIAKWVVEYR